MPEYQWTCPYCGTRQIASDGNSSVGRLPIYLGKSKHNAIALTHNAVRCVNDECNDVTMSITVENGAPGNMGFNPKGKLLALRLMPRSFSKPQPEYIPEPIRTDYNEACLIRDDSPKASATLARRALQGMLHDFCGIKARTLYDEIKALEALLAEDKAPKGVSSETIEAIHAIRKIGNIGAHMEADINVIVDVDPDEAQSLIALIELLFEEWYVARFTRQARLAKILAVDAEKQSAKQPKPKPAQETAE